MTFGRQLRQLLRRLMRQELVAMHFAFPAIIIEYMNEHPDPWGKTSTKGILKGRAIIQPKYKRYRQNREIVEMPQIFDVPVSWHRMGDFIFRFPLHKGDIVMCLVSERALDHLLTDRSPAFHDNKEICRLDDAVILPFGLRTDEDPLFPNEYLEDLYIACVTGRNDTEKASGTQRSNNSATIEDGGIDLSTVRPGDIIENVSTGERGVIAAASTDAGITVEGCTIARGDRYRIYEEGSTPISKFIMRGPNAPIPGEIKFVCPQFTVISPSVDLVDYGGPHVTREGDSGFVKDVEDPVGEAASGCVGSGCGRAVLNNIQQRCNQGIRGAQIVRDAIENNHPEAVRQIEQGVRALGLGPWKSAVNGLLSIAFNADAAGGPDNIPSMTGGRLNQDSVADGIVGHFIRAAQMFLDLGGVV